MWRLGFHFSKKSWAAWWWPKLLSTPRMTHLSCHPWYSLGLAWSWCGFQLPVVLLNCFGACGWVGSWYWWCCWHHWWFVNRGILGRRHWSPAAIICTTSPTKNCKICLGTCPQSTCQLPQGSPTPRLGGQWKLGHGNGCRYSTRSDMQFHWKLSALLFCNLFYLHPRKFKLIQFLANHLAIVLPIGENILVQLYLWVWIFIFWCSWDRRQVSWDRPLLILLVRPCSLQVRTLCWMSTHSCDM